MRTLRRHMRGAGAIKAVGKRGVVLLVTLQVLVGVAAGQAPAPARAADGLPPGVPVPSWAKGKRVHFDPAEPNNPRLAGGDLPASDAEASPSTLSGDSLRYYGGEVQNEPRLVLIFMGTGWESDLARRHELEATAEGLQGSKYQQILTQYSSVDGPISPDLMDSPIIEKVYDTNATGRYPISEAEQAVGLLPEGPGWSSNTTYAVLPTPGTVELEPYVCGYHVQDGGNGSAYIPGGPSVAVILTTERLGCGPPSMILTHEYAESVTDPQGGAGWTRADNGDTEIADVCNDLGPERMADGELVAALWDDSKNACEVEDSDPGSVTIGPYADSSNRNPSLQGSTTETAESERLETSVYPCNLEAHYYFEYGTSTAYGSRTAEAAVPAAWGAVKASATIAGLQHSTPYHWRVVIKTSNGVAYGVDHEFTIPYYVEVQTGEAQGIGISDAELRGEVQSGGIEAKYFFEYGTTEAYGSRTPEASAGSGEAYVAVTAALTGLAPGTLYHYRIVASSSRGTTWGHDRTFTTLGGPPAVETQPATSIGYTGAELNGWLDPKGVATTWYFEYGRTSAYGQRTAEWQTTLSGNQEELVHDLTPDTTYHFRIVAANSYGKSYGIDQTFSTGPEPFVETVAPSAVGYDDATLGGTVNPRGAAVSYYFEYGMTEAYGASTVKATAGSGMTSVQETQTVSGLREGTTYHYRIVATNSYGTTYGADQTLSTDIQPSVQTNAPTEITSAGATLNGAIDPHETKIEYYFEYGVTPEYGSSTTQTSPGSGSGDVEANQTITGLSPGTTYHYRLVASYSSTKRYGNDVTFTTTALPPLPKTIVPQSIPNETPPPPAPHQTPSPPVVQNARQSATRWRESNRRARISRAKMPTGTTFSFSLNERASVNFSFIQLPGSDNGHSCLAGPHGTRQRKSCNRKVAMGALSFTGHDGTNSVVFAGRISLRDKLDPGTCELVITATNAADQRSAPVHLRFTIIQG